MMTLLPLSLTHLERQACQYRMLGRALQLPKRHLPNRIVQLQRPFCFQFYKKGIRSQNIRDLLGNILGT